MKTIYICHAMDTDIDECSKKMFKIGKDIELNEPDSIPFYPYWASGSKLYINKTNPYETGGVDEFRIYGTRITEDMRAEITLAEGLDIRIVPMTNETIKQYYKKIEL